MTRNLRYLFLLVFMGMANVVWAQNSGITGIVLDDQGEPAIGAIIQVIQGGIPKSGAATDIDGKYLIKPLNPGRYDVKVSYVGYKEATTTGVIVKQDQNTEVNFRLEVSTSTVLKEYVVKAYEVPLVDKYDQGRTTLTSEQIEKLPTRNTVDMVSLAGATYQQKSGGAISIAGARANGTQYYIDGIMIQGGSINLPPGAIDQLSVITSGVPAKYGDASGGVVSVTTKGPSAETRGSVSYERSVDGYNRNLAFFDLSGPLLKKKIDSVNKKTVLGYSLNGQYLFEEDPDPNYYDNFVLKGDVLDRIRKNPLVAVPVESGGNSLRYATEYLTRDDFETNKKRVNADQKDMRLVGKLDYMVTDNANLVVGGNYSYTNSRAYSRNRALSLLAPDAIPQSKSYTGRGYVRFTQRFGKPTYDAPVAEGDEAPKKPVITNAFYTVQADYQVTYTEQEDPRHGKNIFDYGYIGKFHSDVVPGYTIKQDTASGFTGVVLEGYNFPTGVRFERSDKNSDLANYTSQVYDIFQGDQSPIDLFDIQQKRGLLNGDVPQSVYGLWSNYGSYITGYAYGQQEQFAFNVDASFDFQPKKTRHAIEFGLYYQQRVERNYSASFSGSTNFWSTMRLLSNRHINSLDFANPIFIKNGQHYTLDQLNSNNIIPSPSDTIIYNRRFDAAAQSTFDKNLRKKLDLPVDGLDFIDIYSLDPSNFSLDMFSADELLNSGDRLVNYYGYDYMGNKLNGQVNFNDWFTKKDANGNYTREVGAFRPNYIAGYIQDRFELPGNAAFNIGVRIERFDANTKVLKDPYSLYATHTVATSDAVNAEYGRTPNNIGSNYVVYIADNQSSNPTVIGYRNGDDWYDPYGRLVQDPNVLKQYSNGRDPQPYLQRNNADGTRALTMRDEGYDPNTSFTDYKPQVNVMPRLSFVFPIEDQSKFFAHYDVIVQRPKSVGEVYATPYDYYYIAQNTNSILPNPDLKPERVFDYEFGFQQEINRYSAITITAYYKERKDMIQARPYLYAWPLTYWTFGNRDFSSTKGITLKYDLRRIQRVSMLLTYTLQFVEGTGSNSNASGLLQNFIAAQLPNMRFTYPLSNDSRHIINVNLDYRFADNDGPMIGNSRILQNSGINLVFRARSGEPYTRNANALRNVNVIQGQFNDARLPWHYMMDLRIDKDFAFKARRRTPDEPVRYSRVGLTAFVYITNLLNTKDILNVYPFTGRPDDDGYLVSPQGLQDAQSVVNPQSYRDLYGMNLLNPGFLNNPRRINLGLTVKF